MIALDLIRLLQSTRQELLAGTGKMAQQVKAITAVLPEDQGLILSAHMICTPIPSLK